LVYSNFHDGSDFIFNKNSTTGADEGKNSHHLDLDDLDLWLLKNADTGFIDKILSQAKFIELKDPKEIYDEISMECEQIAKTPSSTPGLVITDFQTMNSPDVVETTLKAVKKRKRGAPTEIRKIKKRGQNRRAATKYRVKTKVKREFLEIEFDELIKQNVSLKSKIATLEDQVEYFKKSIASLNLPSRR